MSFKAVLDEQGRVTLPSAARRALGVNAGDSVDLRISADGALVLQRAAVGAHRTVIHAARRLAEPSEESRGYGAPEDGQTSAMRGLAALRGGEADAEL